MKYLSKNSITAFITGIKQKDDVKNLEIIKTIIYVYYYIWNE